MDMGKLTLVFINFTLNGFLRLCTDLTLTLLQEPNLETPASLWYLT